MKIKVGDILRSKHDMIITVQDDEEEQVDEGEYFVVVDYGEYPNHNENEICVGYTLLSQKRMTKSRWDKEYCILEDSFIKE
jgi:hypothetical protein